MTKQVSVIVEKDDWYVVADVMIHYKLVDDSFDHEHGTKHQSYYEPTRATLISIQDIRDGSVIEKPAEILVEVIKAEALAKAETP